MVWLREGMLSYFVWFVSAVFGPILYDVILRQGHQDAKEGPFRLRDTLFRRSVNTVL